MRLTALPVALVVTVGLQILLYAANLSASTAMLCALMAGCAAYLLVSRREASEDER